MKTVLVVDDDQELLDLVAFILEQTGFDVRKASNGLEGLEAVAQAMPHLILLDMKMPVMDGWEFAKQLRARHDHATPIVVLTAADDARKRAMEIGAVGWVSKPFDLDTLLNAVRRYASWGEGD